MKKMLMIVSVLLLACFQGYGAAQEKTQRIPPVDADKVLRDLKQRDAFGMFRQNAGKPASPVVSLSGQPTAQAGNAEDSRPVITLPKPQEQVVQPASTPIVQSSPVVVGAPSTPMRVYRRSSSSPPTVRYFALEEPQTYISRPGPSSYLHENGGVSRTFYRHIEYHPLMIEVKLKPNEALSFYAGGEEKFLFKRIEDVPMDGVFYTWKGRQVFLRFGSICGLDGDKDVALALKTGHQEVVVKRARIVTVGSK
jgi:hypothetical protein